MFLGMVLLGVWMAALQWADMKAACKSTPPIEQSSEWRRLGTQVQQLGTQVQQLGTQVQQQDELLQQHGELLQQLLQPAQQAQKRG